MEDTLELSNEEDAPSRKRMRTTEDGEDTSSSSSPPIDALLQQHQDFINKMYTIKKMKDHASQLEKELHEYTRLKSAQINQIYDRMDQFRAKERERKRANRKLCTVDGCPNKRINKGVCVKHGATLRRCSHEGCTNKSANNGVCARHGAIIKRCGIDGCEKFAIKNGVCGKHGTDRCSVEGCNNLVKRRGLCDRHSGVTGRHAGPGWRDNPENFCKFEGCEKQRKIGYFCIRHSDCGETDAG